VLLFFSLALVLNVSASSAASVNQTNVSTPATSLDNMTANISTSNYATADNATTSIKSATTNTSNLNSTVTTNSSIKSATTNTTKTPNLNNTQAAGAPVLVNGLTVAQLKDGTSRAQAFFNKYDRLPTYVSFGTRQIPIATFEQNIATQALKINTVIVNGLNVAQLNDGISRVNAYYAANGRLPTYVSFGTRHIPIATFEQNIATQGLKIAVPTVTGTTNSAATVAKTVTVKAAAATPSTVDGLTLAQVQNGLTRAQSFAILNGRLPTYVSYESEHIPIAQFEQILKAEGLNIVGNANRPIYITSDNITNTVADNARINSIISGLRALGLTAYNMGLGPNKHDSVLTSGALPSDAVVVDIYGGVDAGVINEMGSAWYKSIKGARTVFSVFWPPSEDITGLAWLPRALDDNYDPASFTGIANPTQYLLNNGYDYIQSGVLLNVINAIFYLDKI
jgi:hypothetical protein